MTQQAETPTITCDECNGDTQIATCHCHGNDPRCMHPGQTCPRCAGKGFHMCWTCEERPAAPACSRPEDDVLICAECEENAAQGAWEDAQERAFANYHGGDTPQTDRERQLVEHAEKAGGK